LLVAASVLTLPTTTIPNTVSTPEVLPASVFASVVDRVVLPILILRATRVSYSNAAACQLRERLKSHYGIHLDVIVRDHVEKISAQIGQDLVVTLLTARTGEPFYVHVRKLDVSPSDSCILVSIRELAPDRVAFTRQYGLSQREAEVVQLLLRGYGNRDIAQTLGITPATAKKHLGSIFNKVGVDSRAQLLCRLA
jgi:DNA-binding CsgD family transcriptional regulator